MNYLLNIEDTAKSMVLPCEVYCNGSKAEHVSNCGIIYKCEFEEDLIKVQHLIKADYRNVNLSKEECFEGTELFIPYESIDKIEISLSRIPHTGAFYGLLYRITLDFIIHCKNAKEYFIETSAFEILDEILQLFDNKKIKYLDKLDIANAIKNKSYHEIQEMLNQQYDTYVKEYDLTNMRTTNNL